MIGPSSTLNAAAETQVVVASCCFCTARRIYLCVSLPSNYHSTLSDDPGGAGPWSPLATRVLCGFRDCTLGRSGCISCAAVYDDHLLEAHIGRQHHGSCGGVNTPDGMPRVLQL
ncbi:hypothetical protein EXIGLDRAFT_146973 [Exidia glandulosa HHB12029]|uniref:Uncharacterized protein n=1 Tax=Exidia glandulosa HHB12029 TaxID=1314781 RepID=A0A166A834_EXIGL|nr:hypothetical protein EXIGLDRAFT_146973 [Exidia glandulosa HHB12029]